MRLSDGEKLILFMLSEIYEKLGINGEIDPEFVKDAITTGAIWSLDWKYSGVFDTEDDTPPEVDEVCEILSMWRVLEQSFNDLKDDEKDTVRKSSSVAEVKFEGFDLNNEGTQYEITKCLLEKLDRYEEFKGRYLNTHSQVLPKYRRMLRVYDSLTTNEFGHNLTAANIIEVLKG